MDRTMTQQIWFMFQDKSRRQFNVKMNSKIYLLKKLKIHNERCDYNDRGNEKWDFNDRGNERRDYNDRGYGKRDYNDRGNDCLNNNDREDDICRSTDVGNETNEDTKNVQCGKEDTDSEVVAQDGVTEVELETEGEVSNRGSIENQWKCGKCSFLNDYDNCNCSVCGEAYKNGQWTCRECKYENSCEVEICVTCMIRNVMLTVNGSAVGDGNNEKVSSNVSIKLYVGPMGQNRYVLIIYFADYHFCSGLCDNGAEVPMPLGGGEVLHCNATNFLMIFILIFVY